MKNQAKSPEQTFCLYCDRPTAHAHRTPEECEKAIKKRLAVVKRQIAQHWKLHEERDELKVSLHVAKDMWGGNYHDLRGAPLTTETRKQAAEAALNKRLSELYIEPDEGGNR